LSRNRQRAFFLFFCVDTTICASRIISL